MQDQNDVIEEVVEPQVEHSEQEVKKKDKDENIANMREVIRQSKEQLARQNQQIEELRMQQQSLSQSIQAKSLPEEEDPWNGLEDDDGLEVKKAKEIFSKSLEKAIPKAVKKALEDHEKKQKSDPVYLENEARKRHSDLDEVLAQENIDAIINKVPAVHQAILSSPDPIEAAYQFISNSAAFERKKQSRSSDMVEKAKLQENLKKPKSPNQLSQNQAVSSTPATTAGGFSRLTKQQQKEQWTEHNRRLGRR